MSSWRYAFTSLTCGGWRSLAYLVGLGLALALFSTTLLFIDGSARTLTQRAVAPVLLDFQARAIDPQADITTYAARLAAQPHVTAVLPFASASITVAPTANPTAAATSQSLATRLFAVPPSYLTTFPLLRVTAGSFSTSGMLIGEPLAVQLHLKPGDSVTLNVPGLLHPYPVTITGIVNTEQADPLFTGPAATPEGAFSSTTAVVVIDYATYSRDLRAPLQAADQASQSVPATPPGAAIGLPLLDRQLHIRITRAALPADPGEAQLAVSGWRRSLERQASGQIRITDNVTNTLTTAARDVIAARLLFIFLGLPGILLAAYLSRYATQLVTESQRREIALLRTRGIAPQQILAIMGWTAAIIALLGTVLGVGIGVASTIVLFGAGALTLNSGLVLALAATLVLGLILGGAGIFWPARRMLTNEIAEERRTLTATATPTWLRLPVDVGLLAAGGLLIWLNSGSKTAGVAEAAAVSLGIFAFLGPLLCWLGAALLFFRITYWLLARPLTRWRGGLQGLVNRSLRQRRQQSAGIALLVALALSFGVTTTIFSATFDASRRAEARYLVGSDLRVTPALIAPQLPALAQQLHVPGVQAVTPVFVNNDVLVGAQTQTVYGVDIATLEQATTIPDAFFVNDTARAVLARLAATPNGLLVSNELANAYTILNGDTVAMRFPSGAGLLTDVSVKVVGIFIQFPTSSQNSDLVVNRALLTSVTHNPHAAFFLLKSDGTAAANDHIAQTLTRQLADAHIPARIASATHAISQDQSSLAGLNLAGLAAIDRIYTALIIAIGFGVFLFGLLLERQREFGILQALGASRLQIMRLILGEGWVLVAGGSVGGLLIGVALAWQYTGFLTSIFAVVLPVITLPWSQLGGLVGTGIVGMALAASIVMLRLRTRWPAAVLREE